VRSLFVISLPRSLSSLTYHLARQALGLREPVWTSDGEVLNNDRYATYGDVPLQAGRKFTRPVEQPQLSARLHAFLDQVVQAEGFAYKDVVQPFVVSEWLRRAGSTPAVLRIRRPLADVALSMMAARWWYPARPPWNLNGEGLEIALLRGLVDAEAALDRVPAVAIDYDALVSDERALGDALAELVPGEERREVRYLTAQFLRERDGRLARRRDDSYQRMSDQLAAVYAAAGG